MANNGTKSLRKKNRKTQAAVKGCISITKSGMIQIVSGPRGGGELLIRKRLGFTRPQFARLIPVSERSLADIEKGKEAGESVTRSISQISRMVAALEEIVDPQAIGTWLVTPNDSFDGLKPLEVIERGEIDRIWQMIYELRSGTAF